MFESSQVNGIDNTFKKRKKNGIDNGSNKNKYFDINFLKFSINKYLMNHKY